MTPQAQVRDCPEASRLGRLRHRAAVIAWARSRYSSFRWSRQNASVSATTASSTACAAFDTDFERVEFNPAPPSGSSVVSHDDDAAPVLGQTAPKASRILR